MSRKAIVIVGLPAAISAVSTVRNIGLAMISANEIPYFLKTTPMSAASRMPSSGEVALRAPFLRDVARLLLK
jgi:hypothetical protein